MTSFSMMLDHFIAFLITADPTEKAIVHCSAGIGRTGTTIALAHLIINTWAQRNAGIEEPKVSIFSLVRRLREQRMWMVQMVEQYEFIYHQLKRSLVEQGFFR